MVGGRIIRQSVLNSAGTFLYFFAQWLTTLFVVRLAGYESAGVFSLVVSFTNIFMFVEQYGMRNFQISDVGGGYSVGQYLGAKVITISIAMILFFVCLAILRFENYTVICCLVYMVFKTLETITDFVFGVFQKHLLYKQITVSYFLKSIFPLAGFAFSLAAGKGLSFTLLVMTITYMSIIFVYDFVIYRSKEIISVSFRDADKILRACTPLMLYTLIAPYMIFITRFCIEKIYGKELLGYFSAVSMVIVVMTTLASAVWFVIVPEISMNMEKMAYEKIRRMIFMACLGIIAFGGVTLMVCLLWGDALFGLLFGKAILSYTYLLYPVLVTSILLTAVAFFATILVPMKKRTGILICGLSGAMVCSVTTYPLTKRYGLMGANDSLLIGLFMQLILLAILTARTLRTNQISSGLGSRSKREDKINKSES
jgi:O-antigen/teichoic acid export membrane protein